MCGRFTLFTDWNVILERFDIGGVSSPDYVKRFNIAPSQRVLAVVNDGKENRIGYLQWGLVPFWAKDAKIGSKLINARAETLAEKPSFKHALQKRRCLIPADGFYEWKKVGQEKQPYRMKLKSEEVFAFAGLWERWKDRDGHEINTCTIITTEANDLIKEIHHRMPVILNEEEERIWLDRSIEDPSQLRDLLAPYPAHQMEIDPVSPEVNSPKNDQRALIEPRISNE